MRRSGLALGIALAVLAAGSMADAAPQADARTTPPAADAKQTLYVSIYGPTDVQTWWTCNWTAYVTNGTPPYTYHWSIQGMIETYSSDEYWSGYAAHGGQVGLNVLVTDANGASGGGYLPIFSSSGSPFCMS